MICGVFLAYLSVSTQYFPQTLCTVDAEPTPTTDTSQLFSKWSCSSPLSQGHKAAADQHFISESTQQAMLQSLRDDVS